MQIFVKKFFSGLVHYGNFLIYSICPDQNQTNQRFERPTINGKKMMFTA